ncbi:MULTISPECIES: MFS transporter [Rhodococcus]|uniref:MFS transporter n=1 Tax=Rhodococcus cercidiphylli TaxID=489916 RepID=A0ABU4B210_9NOCA|nr:MULTISPECIES: MFS transporter [Rhodococcus]MDV6232527.1 MFS transporter [Rhodococcus cercidiphylli]MDV8054822.1 MFS transporter [Rhodococcus sp. IEGM 1343]
MSDASFRTRLRESPGVGKLTTIRFAGQFGDGLFQAALSGAILFNPERATNPAEIAAGFAVLLVPYSLVGPFAGALLDRWDRRSVLLWANIVRMVLIVATAILLCAGVDATPLLLLALATVGLSRFVLAGASASLPHVVRQSWLVPMNSVLATVGSGFAAAGAGLAVAVIGVIGAGDFGSGVAVGLSATGSVVGAVAAARFRPRSLGPGIENRTDSPLKDVAAGLKSGAQAVWRSAGVTTAMLGIGAHRIVFGINTLIMVLVLRETTSSTLPGGLAGFGIAVGASAVGMFLAALITPFAVPRFGRTRTIAAALVLAIVAQLGAVSGLTQTSLLLGAFLLGIAGQTVKLSGDAAMQIEIDDAHRGRVFALQDTVFNVAFVAALAAAAFAVGPDTTDLSQDPTAHILVFVGAGIYALGLAAAVVNTGRTRR